MVKERNYIIKEAQISDREFEALVQEYKRSLLVCASRTVKHFVTEHDEEWSITLQAFHKAVTSYDSSKGQFFSFVSIVVRRRLTDWMRDTYRHSIEEPGEIPETLPDNKEWPGQFTVTDEIEAVQDELKPYGFSFFDLTESSPKTQKSRKKCAKVIATLIKNKNLFETMRSTGMLPAKDLARLSGISGKILEKHRRYIIAAAIIIQGDYPLLSEYLHTVREEMQE